MTTDQRTDLLPDFESAEDFASAARGNARLAGLVNQITRSIGSREMDDYRTRLAAAEDCYPFPKWAQWGIEQHTDHALGLFAAVFRRLIEQLAELSEAAPENDKLEAFRQAVEALNRMNEANEILIETDEREDMCKLFNLVATAAGIDPSKYGHGEGPASEWRDW